MKRENILTVPNALSLLRLLGIGLYFPLIQREQFGFAVILLFVAGATDYLDGKIARAFNQSSRLGELLDPTVDRLYIVAILISFLQLELISPWLVFAIVLRDLALGGMLIAMRHFGLPPFKVTYLGKAATFNLLYAFPLLLLTKMEEAWISQGAFILGWAFSIWGIGLYFVTGVSYGVAGVRAIAQVRNSRL